MDSKESFYERFTVTGQEFAEFVSKHKRLPCPVCGTEEPPVIAAKGPDDLAHMVEIPILKPIHDDGRKMAHNVCLAFCPICGFTWSFRADQVLEWVLAQRSEDDHDER